jgi:hypothetical protein
MPGTRWEVAHSRQLEHEEVVSKTSKRLDRSPVKELAGKRTLQPF